MKKAILTGYKQTDKYLFNVADYIIVKNINRGGFGIINLVQNKKSGEKYATKTNLIRNTKQNKRFISREVRILIQIQHPTIIQFRGFSFVDFDLNKNITILMDYMKIGSLASLIDKEIRGLRPDDYDNTKRQIILVGIARGMMVLHSRFVIHRDLKPENILLDLDYHPRITDFGLSKFFDPHHSTNQSMADTGTVAYMAPEVIDGDHYNTKADVYAFGILMYEVITSKRAYSDLLKGPKRLNVFQLKTKVKDGLRPKFPSDVPIKKGLKIMIKKCWSTDPTKRPTFHEIFKKLSLSTDDYFLEFEADYPEPMINDDDDEEEDKDDDDDVEEDEEGFIISKKYCLENVDTAELLDYVDKIKVDAVSIEKQEKMEKENEELKEEIRKMEDEITSLKDELANCHRHMQNEITSLKDELTDGHRHEIADSHKHMQNEEIQKLKSQMKSAKLIACIVLFILFPILMYFLSTAFASIKNELVNTKIEKDSDVSLIEKELAAVKKEKDSDIASINNELAAVKKEENSDISSLKNELVIFKKEKESIKQSLLNIFTVSSSLDKPGILCQLNKIQKSPFDRLFVASQSSNDIYNIISPYSDEYFSTNNYGYFFH